MNDPHAVSPVLLRKVGAELLRYLAGTQMFGLVIGHAGWMLLATATWGWSATDGSVMQTTIRGLLRAYAWLGGVDASGHGNADMIMVVWAKLSLLVYLIDSAWRWLRGERPPWRIGRLMLLSGAIALAGYLVALWPTPDGLAEGGGVMLLFAVLTALATGWAVIVRRLAELLAGAIEQAPAHAPARAARTPSG